MRVAVQIPGKQNTQYFDPSKVTSVQIETFTSSNSVRLELLASGRHVLNTPTIFIDFSLYAAQHGVTLTTAYNTVATIVYECVVRGRTIPDFFPGQTKRDIETWRAIVDTVKQSSNATKTFSLGD